MFQSGAPIIRFPQNTWGKDALLFLQCAYFFLNRLPIVLSLCQR